MGRANQRISINGQIHSSKNSRQVFRLKGRTIVAKSKAAKADEEMLSTQLIEQRGKWIEMTSGAEYPLFVTFEFRRATRAKWDFANLVQGVADAMVKAGYIPDDDVEHFIPEFGGWYVDKQNPGVNFWLS